MTILYGINIYIRKLELGIHWGIQEREHNQILAPMELQGKTSLMVAAVQVVPAGPAGTGTQS